MSAALFPLKIQYGSEFEQAWERYSYKLDKDDAFTAWRQTALMRPELPLLLLCIDEYRARIKKTKTTQKYLAGWLRKRRWEDDMADAQYRLDNPVPKATSRRAFKLSDYPDPLTRPTRTAAEIIAAHRAMKGM